MIPTDYPIEITKVFNFFTNTNSLLASEKIIPSIYGFSVKQDEVWSDCHVIEGQFESPFEKHLPGIMPDKTKIAYFQMILPPKWNSHKVKPICLHLAGTGDHVCIYHCS